MQLIIDNKSYWKREILIKDATSLLLLNQDVAYIYRSQEKVKFKFFNAAIQE